MIRLVSLGVVVALAAASAAQGQTPGPAAAPAPAAAAHAYSTSTTPIGDLLDNPATKAVLIKWIPEVVNDPRIDQGRLYTLQDIVTYVPALTPEMLAKIDADLATVPVK